MKLNDIDRDLLQAADMNELRGIGDSVIAQRIRTEPALRAHAGSLLARLDGLNATIGDFSARRSFNTRPDRLYATASSRRRMPRVGTLVTTGALAAAVVATIIVVRPTPVTTPAPKAVARPLTATLNASSSRPIAVIATDNPDIAIVWLFPKETK